MKLHWKEKKEKKENNRNNKEKKWNTCFIRLIWGVNDLPLIYILYIISENDLYTIFSVDTTIISKNHNFRITAHVLSLQV